MHFYVFPIRLAFSALIAALPFGTLVADSHGSSATSVDAVVNLQDSQSLMTLDQAVDTLLRQGEADRARGLLEELQRQAPRNKDILFMLGMVAMQQGDHDTAIAQFRELLAIEPDAVRVRLELARAFFEAGRDDEAAYHFHLARSGKLPPEVNANIDRYLIAIRNRQEFTWDVNFSIAPDSNINAAPSLEEISIFGIPFKLSDDARRKTGLGLLLASEVEWTPALNDTDQLRLGGSLYHTDYSGSRFDDTQLNAHLGPRFRFARGEISPLVTGFHRWYGGDPYNHGYGLRVEGLWYPHGRVRLGSSMERLRIEHELASSLDGYRTSGTLSGSYVLTPSSGLHGLVGLSRESTEVDMLSNNIYRLGLGYYREMLGGITALVQPEYLQARYDEVAPAFGVKRRDDLWRFRLGLSNRRWVFRGVTPELTFIHSDRSSNIDLYSYARNQVKIGIRRLY